VSSFQGHWLLGFEFFYIVKSMACLRFHAQVAWFIGFEAKAHGL